MKNKIPFEIFPPSRIVKSLLTVAIATNKAYFDKYTLKSIQTGYFFSYFWRKVEYRAISAIIKKMEGNSNFLKSRRK